MHVNDNLPQRGAMSDLWMSWSDPARDGRIDYAIYRRVRLIAVGHTYEAAEMHALYDSVVEVI
jgi:hypothetical protein